MSKEFMTEQLMQVFTYAELSKRLSDCQQLLDSENGYVGEKEVKQKIDELQEVIRKNLKIHMSNSNISQQAMNIINNVRYDFY